jgi:menaquinone-dependent protoporphyrinogen oxidase
VKALIAFDTKHGATEEVAGRIAASIRGRGGEAELLDLRNKGSLSRSLAAYDAVALGAPFYMGQWSKRARAFASARQGELAGKRLALFAVGGNAKLGDRAAKEALPPAVSGSVSFSAYFGGRYDFGGLGAFERFIIKKVTGKTESFSTLDLAAADAFGAKLAEARG